MARAVHTMAIFMKIETILGLLAVSLLACEKKGRAHQAMPTTTGTAAAAAAPSDCEKIVEKIASLNPPDSRGEPEKKPWRGMCAQMKAEEKTCVMGAKVLDDTWESARRSDASSQRAPAIFHPNITN